MADLHVHTVLSPCAEYRMVPALIIERAIESGLDMLAITDHNSGENAAAVMSAALDSGVTVFPGMEVETREGVHILTIFDTVDSLVRWQEQVYRALPNRENDDRAFGTQLIVDAEGNLLSVNRRLLITAVDLSIDEVVATVQQAGGVSIPAHVDRPSSGLLGGTRPNPRRTRRAGHGDLTSFHTSGGSGAIPHAGWAHPPAVVGCSYT